MPMSEIPYVGCKISLISKSEIRYEGTLNSINSIDATVTLENVQSFGSEGRRGGNKEIPPTNQLYELIVFRGTDIKELKVNELPKSFQQQPSSTGYTDTASNPPPYGTFHSSSMQRDMPPSMHTPLFTPMHFESSPMPPMMHTPDSSFHPQIWSQYAHPMMSQQFSYPYYHQQPAFSNMEEFHSPLQNMQDTLSKSSFNSNESKESFTSTQQAPIEDSSVSQSADSQSKYANYAFQKQPSNEILNSSLSKTNDIYSKDATISHQADQLSTHKKSSYENYYKKPQPFIKDFVPKSRQPIHLGEFDFEQSNSLLKKEEHSQMRSAETFYSKSNFFDAISCESNEQKSNKKATFRQEKSLNLETFGIAGTNPRPFRSRPANSRSYQKYASKEQGY